MGGDRSTSPQEMITDIEAFGRGRGRGDGGRPGHALRLLPGGAEVAGFASYTIVAMIVAYTAISLINTLVSSSLARRREFGLQLTGSPADRCCGCSAPRGSW